METKTVSFLNKLSFIILSATVFLSFFFFLPYTSISLAASKGFLLSIGISISLFFWLIARLGEGAFSIPRNKSILFGFAIPVIFLISSIFSVSKYSSFFGSGFEIGTTVSMFILFLIFFLSSLYFQTEKRLWYFYGMIFVSSAVLVLFEIILVIGNMIKPGIFANFLRSITSGNLLGSWSDFAIFFGLISLLCIYTLDLLKTKGVLKILQYVLLFFAFLFLALVNLSLVWILIGAFSVILFVYSISFQQAGVTIFHGGATRKKFPFTALVSIFICFIFLVGGTTISSFVNKYIPITNNDIRPNVKATTNITYHALRANPITGTGPNTFDMDWAKWRPNDVIQTQFWSTDFNFGFGLIPTFASTTGILGFFAFLAFIFFILYTGIKAFKKVYKDSLSNYFYMTLSLMILYTWTICIVYTPSIMIVVLAYISSGVFIAMLVYKKFITMKKISFLEDPRHSFFSILTLVGLLIGTISLTYVFAKRFTSVMYFSKSLQIEDSIEGFNKAEIMQSNAIVLSQNDSYYRALSQVYLSQIRLLVNDKNLSEDRLKTSLQQLIGSSEQVAKQAVAVNRNQYLNHLNLANIYSSFSTLKVDQSYENGVLSYDQALKLSPNNPSIILGRAQLELTSGNKEKALEFIDQSLSIKPNYADALFLKSQIYLSQNDTLNAIKQIETASLYYPNDPNIYFQLGQLQYANKDYARSVVSFENAVILNPSYANARFMLGKAYQQTGSNDKALVQFKILEDAEPDNADIKEAIKSISAPKVTPEMTDANKKTEVKKTN